MGTKFGCTFKTAQIKVAPGNYSNAAAFASYAFIDDEEDNA
jgi:hypothetical protein